MKKVLLIVLLPLWFYAAVYSQDSITKPAAGHLVTYAKLRIGVQGGIGYLVSGSKSAEEAMTGMGFDSGQAKSYYRNLKSGIGGNASLAYMLTPQYGLGLRYKYFQTSAATEGFVDPGDGVSLYYGNYGENIYVNFAGAAVFCDLISKSEKFGLNTIYSLGLATYRNEAEYINSFVLLTGRSFGGDIAIEAEYKITANLSVTAGLSAFYSSIRKIKISDGTTTSNVDLGKDNYENLSRIDFSLGISVNLWNK